MIITTVHENNFEIAVVKSDEVLITDVQSALDLMATIRYETNCDRMILYKSVIIEHFFDLKTRIAGDILQKYVNYNLKAAIIGDFSTYSSKSLKDFIYESNKGKHFFFLSDEKQAVQKLCIE